MLYQHKRCKSITGKVGFLILFSCVISVSNAQIQETEDLQDDQVQSAFLNTVANYDKQLRRNAMIYTGRSYYDEHSNIQGHQFFIEDYWEQGNINYNGQVYDSIFIKYDIFRDLLLIENFNSDGFLSPIILYKQKISWFDLMGYHFVHLEKDTISSLKEGFYNQMYKSDNIEVLIKRRKEIVNSTSVNSLQEMFNQKDRYYIKKDNLYHQVRKRKSVLKLFEDQKKEVKSFIKKNRILFKTNADIELVAVVKYYESL